MLGISSFGIVTKRVDVDVHATFLLTVKSIVLGLYAPDANLRDIKFFDALAAVVRSAFMMGWRVKFRG